MMSRTAVLVLVSVLAANALGYILYSGLWGNGITLISDFHPTASEYNASNLEIKLHASYSAKKSVITSEPPIPPPNVLKTATIPLNNTVSTAMKSRMKWTIYKYTAQEKTQQSGNMAFTDNVKYFKKSAYFHQVFNDHDKSVIINIVQKFHKLMEAANLLYFISSGSLIGSYRHHGIIPWDDDLDVLVPITIKDKVKKALSGHKPDYVLETGKNDKAIRWKFYSSNSRAIENQVWKWPFLDICFYIEDQDSLWDSDPNMANLHKFKKSYIFPLIKRPFESLELYAPKNTYKILMKTYDIDTCMTGSWNHKEEKRNKNTYEVPCKTLYHKFPFVFRETSKTGVVEILKIRDKILQKIFIPN